MSDILNNFIAACEDSIEKGKLYSDYVDSITPLMHQLLTKEIDFLEDKHFTSDSDGYCRNAIYVSPALSLFSLVWLPGQFTPIHDHGTWGIVGVFEGSIKEKNYLRTDNESKDALRNLKLQNAGSIILTPGSVTSFVPNPDHIHKTGNQTDERVVSLHLYGHSMSGYHIYDLNKGTREWVEVNHV